ncbi:MAG: leucine-rich repeat domain-containing protein [Clostridia bacterium]|nr:leucine-rich repeat domain-containing protein [Clostridia bacterium]
MKKFLVLFLAIFMIVSLISCKKIVQDSNSNTEEGSNEHTTSESSNSTSSETPENSGDIPVNGLKFKLNEDKKSYCVTGYYTFAQNPSTDQHKVIIPETHSNLPVISIDNEAFAYTPLEEIVIPSSIVHIGERAFRECRQLKSVVIPSSITSWGMEAFWGAGLETVTLSQGLTTISEGAFSNCKNLKSITIPDSVEIIGDSAFANCFLPTELIIPDSVKKIGDNAFASCSNLKSITVSNNLTELGSNAFGEVLIFGKPAAAPYYNEYDNGYYLGNENNPYLIFAKVKDTSRDSCQINPNTKFIHSEAFRSSAISSIVIPNGVISLGSAAFFLCENLENVSIPNSITHLGSYAFDSVEWQLNCYEDENGYYIGNEENNYIVFLRGKNKADGSSYTVHPDAKFIYTKAFEYYGDPQTITLYNQIIFIDSAAFYSCDNLNNIVYNGTKVEWEKIRKNNSWKEDASNFTITCSDGVISN